MRIIAVLLCAAALTLPIAALSRAPFTTPGSDAAILRFSWRMSVAATETCRPRTAEELAALPVHMRTPQVCTRDLADYALITRIDDAAADTLDLVRGGVKGDRPLFVLEERTLPPGEHRVRVELQRRSRGDTEVLASLDTLLVATPGTVQLVTLDLDGRRLTARSSH